MVEKLLPCEQKIVSFQFHNHAVFVAHGDKRHSGFGRTVAFVKYFKYVVLPPLCNGMVYIEIVYIRKICPCCTV